MSVQAYLAYIVKNLSQATILLTNAGLNRPCKAGPTGTGISAKFGHDMAHSTYIIDTLVGTPLDSETV